MNQKRKLHIACICLSILLACTKESPETNDYQTITLGTKASALVTANNQFGFELFKELAKDEDNLFISPLSVSQALGMCYNGATEETADEIATTLGYNGAAPNDINQSASTIRQSLLAADKKVTLTIANSIWSSNQFSIAPAFVLTNKTYYNAETSSLDFTNVEASKKRINDWVNDQTRGKIPSIINEIKPEHVMFLINAVYFKGAWKYSFDKSNTQQRTFYNNAVDSKQVEMMAQEADLAYLDSEKFRAVELPYGNSHFSMVVMLPKNANTLQDIVAELNGENWNGWMQDFAITGVKIDMPKFKLECDLELNEPLKNLGMPRAFTDTAQFSQMGTPSNLMITEVKHKTFVEVGEEGTEAAAVTSIGVGVTSIGNEPAPSVIFSIDRPFVFAIREKDTGSVVFIGQIKSL